MFGQKFRFLLFYSGSFYIAYSFKRLCAAATSRPATRSGDAACFRITLGNLDVVSLLLDSLDDVNITVERQMKPRRVRRRRRVENANQKMNRSTTAERYFDRASIYA